MATLQFGLIIDDRGKPRIVAIGETVDEVRGRLGCWNENPVRGWSFPVIKL